MKEKVQVFILLHGAPHKSHVSHLNSLFSDRIFDVELKPACPISLQTRIMECLKESWRRDPQGHCLVLTDRVVSTCNSKAVTETIRTCIKTKNFDLCYLFKYNDRCQMHSEIVTDWSPQSLNQGVISIVNSHSPNGLEAILYSPVGRSILLGKLPMKDRRNFSAKKDLESALRKAIYDGNLRCIATTPNLFQYDILNNALSHRDYQYRNECLPLQLIPKPAVVSNSRILVMLAFVFILIIAVAWALLQLNGCC